MAAYPSAYESSNPPVPCRIDKHVLAQHLRKENTPARSSNKRIQSKMSVSSGSQDKPAEQCRDRDLMGAMLQFMLQGNARGLPGLQTFSQHAQGNAAPLQGTRGPLALTDGSESQALPGSQSQAPPGSQSQAVPGSQSQAVPGCLKGNLQAMQDKIRGALLGKGPAEKDGDEEEEDYEDEQSVRRKPAAFQGEEDEDEEGEGCVPSVRRKPAAFQGSRKRPASPNAGGPKKRPAAGCVVVSIKSATQAKDALTTGTIYSNESLWAFLANLPAPTGRPKPTQSPTTYLGGRLYTDKKILGSEYICVDTIQSTSLGPLAPTKTALRAFGVWHALQSRWILVSVVRDAIV